MDGELEEIFFSEIKTEGDFADFLRDSIGFIFGPFFDAPEPPFVRPNDGLESMCGGSGARQGA